MDYFHNDQLNFDNKFLYNSIDIDMQMYLIVINMYHYYNMVDLNNNQFV
jgi:hypothetical protein